MNQAETRCQLKKTPWQIPLPLHLSERAERVASLGLGRRRGAGGTHGVRSPMEPPPRSPPEETHRRRARPKGCQISFWRQPSSPAILSQQELKFLNISRKDHLLTPICSLLSIFLFHPQSMIKPFTLIKTSWEKR